MSSLSLNTPSLSAPSSLSFTSPSSSFSSIPTSTSAPITATSSSSSSSSSFFATSSSPSTNLFSSVSTSASSTTSTTLTASAISTQQSYSSLTSASLTTSTNTVPDPSSSGLVYTSPAITPSHTATSSSSSGFFSNTGAVAGTFTVIGLVGIAGVIAVVLFIIRRHQARSYEDDMEYLDKTPNLSLDPPTTQPTSPDDRLTDHDQSAPPPMHFPSSPTVYYPDHAYALHPQAFSADTTASLSYPAGHTQGYTTQHNYSQANYHTPCPPSAVRLNPGMPNPHEFAHVELASTPAQPTQNVPPHPLRPSVPPTSNTQKQWANARFSVDSFYTGIAVDNQTSRRA